MAPSYDYIIVGAGSAGCVLAHRLTEDPGVQVLLVEAGGRDDHLYIQMPAAFPMAARDPRFDWAYVSEPEPECQGRTILEHRGKVLGGSSSINGLVANRGNPRDYDTWAAQGLCDWSFAHCLPYFRKMETFSGGPSDWRGGNGPQSIELCAATHPLHQAFLEAGVQAGYQRTPDQNAACHEGFHVAQSFTRQGRRASTAAGYLHPVLHRANLTLKLRTLTRRVLFDGRRACGIEVQAEGAIQRFEAAREVILCAGAIGSPHILLLSGVGDPSDLRSHGIKPVAQVPAVGRHLEDHPIVPIMYDTPKGVSLSHRLKGIGRYRVGLQWLLFKSGIGAESIGQTGCFFRSTAEAEYADLQHEFYPLIADIDDPKANFSAGLLFSLGLMRPWSRGQISLKSADPKVHPRLVLNYLKDERDRRVLVEGVKRTREMAAQRAFDGLRLGEVQPGPDVRSDGEILSWLRQMATTEYHVCASCRMGLGDDSVTDGAARVHSTEGLRVVDASIMPHNVTANLNMPVIMIAEKLADVIRGRTPLPASTLVPQ